MGKADGESTSPVRILSFNNAGVNPVYANAGRLAQEGIPGTGADVFGLQEVAEGAIPQFHGYTRITGDWTGSEYLPVYFRSDRFDLLAEISLGLPQDPRDHLVWEEVVYGPFRRGFTGVRLRGRDSGRTLVLINTHLGLGGSAADHVTEIVRLSESFRQDADLVVLAGDFNHDRRQPSGQIPPPGFSDGNCDGDLTPTKPVADGAGTVIDYLFFLGGNIRSTDYTVHRDILSDHHGVSALFHFRTGQRRASGEC